MATISNSVKVLHKALDVLERIKAYPAGMTLAELSAEVGMPKATVYRILATLEARGYLHRDTAGRYALARKFFMNQEETPLEQRLIRSAQPVMEELTRLSKETVNLGILDGGEVVVIGSVESPQTVRMASKVGNRRYLHSTALGKILLSGLPVAEVQRLLRVKGTPALTPYTVTKESAILAEVADARNRGFAFDNQENEMEGRCVAAGITGPHGEICAALSVSGPEFRVDKKKLESLVAAVQAACERIAQGLTALPTRARKKAGV